MLPELTSYGLLAYIIASNVVSFVTGRVYHTDPKNMKLGIVKLKWANYYERASPANTTQQHVLGNLLNEKIILWSK